MTDDAERNLRVASIADEKYLPAGWLELDSDDHRYEFVWMLDNTTNLPVEVSIIDTLADRYQVAKAIIVEPTDMSTWSVVAMSDEWLPLPAEEV